MKRMFFLFFASFMLLQALVHGALVQLSPSNAEILCLSASSPCYFYSNGIWDGGNSPVNGDDVSMVMPGSANTTVYIQIDSSTSLNSLQVSGPVVLFISSLTLTTNELNIDNSSQVFVRDSNLLIQTVVITNEAKFQLDGQTNLTVTDFTEIGADIHIFDTSILQGTFITLDSINATSDAVFVGYNVTILPGDVIFMCPVRISTLTAQGFPAFISGGYFGNVSVVSNADVYAFNDVTVSKLNVGANGMFYSSGNVFFEGAVSGVGTLRFTDAEIILGNNKTTTNLQGMSVVISGETTGNFYNVEFGAFQTVPDGNIPPQVALNLWGCSFCASTSFASDIKSVNLTVETIELNITGTVNSSGTLMVMGGGLLNVTKLVHRGGSVSVNSPIYALSVDIGNTTLDIGGSAIYGTTNLTSTTILSTQTISFYGSISLTSTTFMIDPQTKVYVSGDIYSFGGGSSTTLSGNITANSFYLHDGLVDIQGTLTAPQAEFRNSILSIQNQTTLNCHGILIETSIFNVDATLYINGYLLLHSFQLSSDYVNQTIYVNGSVYSTGNSSVASSVNLVASTFTHVGDFISIEGTISAVTIGFAAADVYIGPNPTTFNGNISMVDSVVRLHSRLLVQGFLMLRSSLQASTPQTLEVTNAIISADTTFIYENIIVITPTYYQTSGVLHLSGQMKVNSVMILKGAILSTKLPIVIHGDVRVTGGLLEFHNSTNITGILSLDSTSQTMLYNAPTHYPIVHVDGSVHLDGGLVYWLANVPNMGVELTYKIMTYSSDLSGKFSTYDAYAPDVTLLKFKLIYGDKEITLKYNPSKPLGTGAMVGIILAAVACVVGIIVLGLFLYRRYARRQDYTSIIATPERIEEEIDKYMRTNTPANIQQ